MPDAQNSLTWTGYPDAGEIRERQGTLWATYAGELLGQAASELPGKLPGDGRVVVRSGSLDGPAFETWGPKGWEALQARCEALAGSGAELLVLPHAGDVLSDVQRCLKFLDRWAEVATPIGLVLDPSALMTESMLDRAADHLGRMAASLLSRRGVAGVVVPDEAKSGRISASEWEPIIAAARAHRVPVIAACQPAQAVEPTPTESRPSP